MLHILGPGGKLRRGEPRQMFEVALQAAIGDEISRGKRQRPCGTTGHLRNTGKTVAVSRSPPEA